MEEEIQPEVQKEEAPAPAEPAAQAVQPEKEIRAPGLLTKVFRWVLGLLVIFGLGAILAIYLLYIPERQKTDQAKQQISVIEAQAKADQEMASQQIKELETRVDQLSALEPKNKELQDALSQADVRTALLTAQVDIANAQLALMQNDALAASSALEKTPELMEGLKGKLASDQQKVWEDLSARLNLAISEIGKDSYAAQSDLDVLMKGLQELESAFTP